MLISKPNSLRIRDNDGHSGIKLLDKLWSIVTSKVLTNERWRSYESKIFCQAWGNSIDKVDSYYLDDSDQERLSKFLNEAPWNIQNPVWTCWQTMIATTDVFLEHYVSIYFLAISLHLHFYH